MSKYEQIFAYLQESVNNGEMNADDAQAISDAAFERYHGEVEETAEQFLESLTSDFMSLEEAVGDLFGDEEGTTSGGTNLAEESVDDLFDELFEEKVKPLSSQIAAGQKTAKKEIKAAKKTIQKEVKKDAKQIDQAAGEVVNSIKEHMKKYYKIYAAAAALAAGVVIFLTKTEEGKKVSDATKNQLKKAAGEMRKVSQKAKIQMGKAKNFVNKKKLEEEGLDSLRKTQQALVAGFEPLQRDFDSAKKDIDGSGCAAAVKKAGSGLKLKGAPEPTESGSVTGVPVIKSNKSDREVKAWESVEEDKELDQFIESFLEGIDEESGD